MLKHPSTLATAVAVAAIAAAYDARADPDCVELRRRIAHEHERAARWNEAWGIGLGVVAVAQAAAAPFVGDHVERDTLYAGAIDSAIGAAASLVTPLRVDASDPSATCTELQAAVVVAGRRERGTFYLNHVGGLLLNLGSALVLSHYTGAKNAALAFAVGYSVALARTYTMPRWAWHPTITLDPKPAVGIALATSF
jgi:hypothetical protein